MTSAEEFAETYSAFWRDATPMLERYVRLTNLNVGRFAPQVRSNTTSSRHAIISEAAFINVRNHYIENGKCYEGDLTAHGLSTASYEARERIGNLPGVNVDDRDLTPEEVAEGLAIGGSLCRFLGVRAPQEIVFEPGFRGCGFLDAARGDLLIGRTLFELKTVERPFRSVDIKQLLTYCALNAAAATYEIDAIGVVNPRRGIFFEDDLELISRRSNGLAASDLMHRIVEYVQPEAPAAPI